MEFPLPMGSYSDELFRPDSPQIFSCEAIQLQLDPSTILPEFMSRIMREAGRHQQVTVDVISKVSREYGHDLWAQWDINSDDQKLREFAFNKIQAELAAVEEFSCRMLQLPMAPTYTAFSSPVAMDTVYTPSSTCYSSPALPYAQPAPSYGSTMNFDQDTQLFPRPQLQHPALTRPQCSISLSSYRPKCYKEEMLEGNPAETHKWFGEFLKLWIDENWYATEFETVVFINKHQRYIEDIFIALQATDSMTLDLPKWQSVRSGISQKHFYFAAVQTCYTIEKRLRVGPLERHGAHAKTGDDFDGRVEDVCRYLLSCKNSCVRICNPSFLDEVVDQPSKMFERFQTNCKGNASKRNRNEKRKRENALVRASGRGTPARGTKSKRIDPLRQASVPLPMHPSVMASSRTSRSRAAAPAEGVTKERTNPRSTRGRINYMEYDEGEDDEEENTDDEYEQYPIHVALPNDPNITISEDLNIDPALLQTTTATDLGNIGDDFDLQHLQYPW
ncbi:hypothetical protein EV426DRAFT_577888 [Tirmania nivea]|nr:hypothetical protein EV426DRAFT_577888 [Tirmania nivea]